MKKSKYVGKQYDGGWYCSEIFLAANYSCGTKHNAYRYKLVRLTSDLKCDKIITVSGATMLKIARGILTAESVAENKVNSNSKRNEILYKFI